MAYRICHVFYDGLCRALDPASAKAWQTVDWLKEAVAGPTAPAPVKPPVLGE
jgi:hypothetical protein